jgi:hypothetical protein
VTVAIGLVGTGRWAKKIHAPFAGIHTTSLSMTAAVERQRAEVGSGGAALIDLQKASRMRAAVAAGSRVT